AADRGDQRDPRTAGAPSHLGHPFRVRSHSAAGRTVGAMGLLRHRDDGSHPHRFQMREKLFAIGEDYWIEDEDGNHIYKVNGKAMRVRDTFILEDLDGNEIVK